MKRPSKIFLFLTFLSASLFAQVEDTNKILSKDSLKIRFHPNSLNEIQIKFDEFELYRNLYSMNMSVSTDNDPQTVWLRTSIILSQNNKLQNETPDNLLAPLYNQYLETTKFDQVRYFLGMAQAGAVGYLVYKHIKKFGFYK
jgi:hypothetical protein